MAILEVNYVSKVLFRTVTLQVILPVDKIFKNEVNNKNKKYKTLYLLHGLIGNQTDWISGTRIQRWAEEKDLAVVMPAGENGFYVDQGNWRDYGKFIGEELVEMTRKMFPLSDKREDTFIGGLSMGGFGALRNGLKYHDTFSHIIALSSALHIFEDYYLTSAKSISFEESCFGDLQIAKQSDKNPYYLIKDLSKKANSDSSINLPKVYLACGTEDGLLKANKLYKGYLEENGFDLTYTFEPGGHEWDFWDSQIYKALNWLPLVEAKAGINSGNVTLK